MSDDNPCKIVKMSHALDIGDIVRTGHAYELHLITKRLGLKSYETQLVEDNFRQRPIYFLFNSPVKVVCTIEELPF